MSEKFVTRCPHCGTTFKVTSVHLSAANGSVRCGACLKIFAAKNHMVEDSRATKTQIPEKNLRSPGNSQHPQQGTGIKTTNDFKPTPTKPDPHEEIFAPDEDEFNFGELSEEMTQATPQHSFGDPMSTRMTASTEEDESWAENLLEENDDFEPKITFDDGGLVESNDPFNQDFLDGTVAIDALDTRKTINKDKEPGQQNLYDNIGDDPLELEFDRTSDKSRMMGWFIASLVMVLIAVGQMAWYKLDTWSKLDQFRPFYTQLCQLAPCKIPPQLDVAAIRTGNLIIRKNIKNPSELIVDAILINQAPFEQPFSNIILEFSDINGELIADGQFSPDQYLRGELTGALMMPIKTPIHISFAIQNPGPRAVNYKLRYK